LKSDLSFSVAELSPLSKAVASQTEAHCYTYATLATKMSWHPDNGASSFHSPHRSRIRIEYNIILLGLSYECRLY